MTFARVFLWLFGAVFLVFGLVALVNPGAMIGPAGIEAGAAGALAEVRAVYGGLQIGLALLLVWSALDPSRYASGLLAYGLILGSVGDCRALGLLIEGTHTPFHLIALAFEWGSAILALVAWYRLTRD